MRNAVRARTLMIAAAVSWAAATVLTKVVLHELTPIDLIGVELNASAIAVVVLLALRQHRLALRRDAIFAGVGVI
jgi:drug/metabolite transporter (DMT)-like permease